MRRSTFKKLLMGVAIAVIVLGAAELVLRLAGFRFAISYVLEPIFEKIPGTEDVRTKPMFTRTEPYGFAFAVDQRFPVKKPAGTVRIVIAGGSSVFRLGDAPLLRKLLQDRTGKHIEVLNFGFQGCGSDRVLLSVREAMEYDPDILILYTGNNEFVSFSNPATMMDSNRKPLRVKMLPNIRLAQLTAKIALSMAKPSRKQIEGYQRTFTVADKQSFYEDFERNLDQMVSIAREQGVSVLLCTVPYNYLASPAKSARNLDVQEVIARGAAWVASELSKHPDDAILLYASGLFRVRDGDMEEGKVRIDRAFLNDLTPFRADLEINGRIRDVARKRGVVLVDVEQAISARSGRGFPDYDWLDDHCHLNETGRVLLQEEVARVLLSE